MVQKEGKWYVFWCPELDIASQGETKEEAIENRKEAIELSLEDEDAQIPAAGQIFTTKVEFFPCQDFPSHQLMKLSGH